MIRNYNYDLDTFLGKVRALVERDAQLLGFAVQRTILTRETNGAQKNARTDIAFLKKGQRRPKREELNYGHIVLIKEVLKIDELLLRLNSIREGKFRVSNLTVSVRANPGLSDSYEPSPNEYGLWPGTLFDISGEQSRLSGSPLLHFDLPAFETEWDAVGWFFKLNPRHGFQNACQGQIRLFIPNCRSRIEEVSLDGEHLVVKLWSTIPWKQLRYKLVLWTQFKQHTKSVTPARSVTKIPLPFAPTHLSFWVLSERYGLVDFYQETEYWNQGDRPSLLAKREPERLGIPFATETTRTAEPDASMLIFPTVQLIFSARDIINAYVASKFEFKLFDVHEQRVFTDLARPCQTELEFAHAVQALHCLVDWINVKDLKAVVVRKPRSGGSINMLEAFLREQFPKYDTRIVKNLRRITPIRKKYPIHRDTKEVIEAFQELGEKYPPSDWNRVWIKLLESYLESLTLLRDTLAAGPTRSPETS